MLSVLYSSTCIQTMFRVQKMLMQSTRYLSDVITLTLMCNSNYCKEAIYQEITIVINEDIQMTSVFLRPCFIQIREHLKYSPRAF